jgi:pheromone shutdown protein TraB
MCCAVRFVFADLCIVTQHAGVCDRASKVVAVVGAGHLQGIRESWTADIDFEEISKMPAQPQKQGRWRWNRVALIGVSGAALTALLVIRWRR